MALDIRSLRFFVQIAEMGSLGLAARSLNIAQPALSQRLANLEDHLGVQLLQRSSKGVTLTDDGSRLLDHARKVLAQIREIEEDVGRTGPTLRGRVVIGMPAPVADFLVEPLFRAACAKEPEIRIRVEEMQTRNLLEALLEGQLDLAVTAQQSINRRVETELLVEERLCLIGAPGSVPATVFFADLFSRPLIFPNIGQEWQERLDQYAAEQGGKLDIRLESSSLTTNKRLIANDGFFGIMAHSAVAREVAAGELDATVITDAPAGRALYLCRLVDRRHSRAASYLAVEVKRQMAILAQKGTFT